jgi:cell division transport system permease protein
MKNFWRNGWLSFATVSIMSISLFIMSVTIMIIIGSDAAIKNVQNKINISVYFNPEVKEERIIEIQNSLKGYKEIRSIEYVSKEKALEELKQSALGQDSTVKKALEEVGENPLYASLVIKAQDSSQYDIVNQAIEKSYFKEEVSWVNYEKNREEIDKLNKLVSTAEKTGLILGVIFIAIAIMITFNTIRITIYAHKYEFEIMRLVGASNMYVRMPYIFEGIFYGIVSALTVLAMLFVSFQFIAPTMSAMVSRDVLVSFYMRNFLMTAVLLFFAGCLMGIISSIIAVRRYLKI